METIEILSVKKRNPIARIFSINEWKVRVRYRGKEKSLRVWANCRSPEASSAIYSISEKLGMGYESVLKGETIIVGEEKLYKVIENKTVKAVTHVDVLNKINQKMSQNSLAKQQQIGTGLHIRRGK